MNISFVGFLIMTIGFYFLINHDPTRALLFFSTAFFLFIPGSIRAIVSLTKLVIDFFKNVYTKKK